MCIIISYVIFGHICFHVKFIIHVISPQAYDTTRFTTKYVSLSSIVRFMLTIMSEIQSKRNRNWKHYKIVTSGFPKYEWKLSKIRYET